MFSSAFQEDCYYQEKGTTSQESFPFCSREKFKHAQPQVQQLLMHGTTAFQGLPSKSKERKKNHQPKTTTTSETYQIQTDLFHILLFVIPVIHKIRCLQLINRFLSNIRTFNKKPVLHFGPALSTN